MLSAPLRRVANGRTVPWLSRASSVMVLVSVVGPALLLTVALLLPIMMIWQRDLSLVGLMEESAGYRYFHTLRILYGSGERPWLPQGQSVGVLYMVIHSLLSALGHPPTELFPRFDLFTFAAAGLPLAVSGIVLIWTGLSLRSVISRALAAVLLAYVLFDRSSFNGVVTLTPDYLAWAFPFALIMAGWLIRLAGRQYRATISTFVLLGIFTGVCLSTKPTYAVFLVPLYVWLLIDDRSIRRVLHLTVSSVLGILTGILIIAAYYLGDPKAVVDHFDVLLRFGQSAGSLDAIQPWVMLALTDFPPNAGLIAIFTPLALLIGLVVLPQRQTSFALLCGSLLATGVAYSRFYTTTLVETNAMFVGTAIVWFAVVANPAGLLHGRQRRALQFAATVVSLVLLAIMARWTYQRIDTSLQTALWSTGASTLATSQVHAFLDQHPGRTLYLIPDNSRRPLTVDSAIFKGGTDIYVSTWGTSPYVASLFADRSYLFGGDQQTRPPADLGGFDKLVFVLGPPASGAGIRPYTGEVRDQEWVKTRAVLYETFQIRVEAFDCPVEAHVTNNSLVVACVRRQEPLATSAAARASLIENGAWVSTTSPIVDAQGRTRKAAPGDLLYTRSSGELFRVDAETQSTRLTGQPGQGVILQDHGGWNRERGTFTGTTLTAGADGVTWKPTPGWQLAASQPLTAGSLSTTPAGGAARGWSIQPDDGSIATEWLSDEDGIFLRLTARRQNASFVIQWAPEPSLAGAPLTLRTMARSGSGNVKLWNAAYDRGPRSPEVTTARQYPLGAAWTTFPDAIPPLTEPVDQDRIGAGASEIALGDTVDIRGITVFTGAPFLERTADCCPVHAEELPRSGRVTATYVATAAASPGQAAGYGAGAATVPFEVDDLIYVHESGDLVRLGEHGSLTHLIGRAGQRIQVEGVGAWDPNTRRLQSTDATFRRGRWVLSDDRPDPSNPDPQLRGGPPNALGPDWTLGPANVPATVERGTESDRRFVRLRMAAAADIVRIEGSAPLTSPDGAPLTVRTRVRISRPGVQTELRAEDATAGGQRAPRATHTASDGGWFDLALVALDADPPEAARRYALVLHGLQAGDTVDVSEIGVYAGLFR